MANGQTEISLRPSRREARDWMLHVSDNSGWVRMFGPMTLTQAEKQATRISEACGDDDISVYPVMFNSSREIGKFIADQRNVIKE